MTCSVVSALWSSQFSKSYFLCSFFRFTRLFSTGVDWKWRLWIGRDFWRNSTFREPTCQTAQSKKSFHFFTESCQKVGQKQPRLQKGRTRRRPCRSRRPFLFAGCPRFRWRRKRQLCQLRNVAKKSSRKKIHNSDEQMKRSNELTDHYLIICNLK